MSIGNSILQNGLIAKITACFVIVTMTLSLVSYIETQFDLVFPIIASLLSGAMTFLFMKRDRR